MERNRRNQTHRQGNPPTSSNHNPSRPPNFRTQECKYWAKGSCYKGDSCTYKHSDSNHTSITCSGTLAANNMRPANRQLQQVCVHFMGKGTCKFGDDCKFTHIKPVNKGGETKQIEDRTETFLFNLKEILESFSRSNQFHSIGQFEEFLDVALKVLDSDEKEARIDAIIVLTSNENESGLELIRHVIEYIGSSVSHTPVQGNQNPLQDLDYDHHIVPFMKIMVHDAFTRSCVEKSFRLVLKGIYGPDGEYAIKFLKRMVHILENKSLSCDVESIKTIMQEDCFLVCRILYYVIRYNAQTIGHDALIDIHARLRDVSVPVRTPLSSTTDRYLMAIGVYLKSEMENETDRKYRLLEVIDYRKILYDRGRPRSIIQGSRYHTCMDQVFQRHP
jgi:hypothetical protein